MASLNHTHTYVRWQIGRKDKLTKGERTYKCNHPDCSHFTVESLVKGKRSLCTKCGEPFVIDPYTLRTHSQLKCINCRNTKEAKISRASQAIINEALNLNTKEETIEHDIFSISFDD